MQRREEARMTQPEKNVGADDEKPTGTPVPLRTWLWVQMREDTYFAPLARYILAGGPDGRWDTKRAYFLKDIVRDLELFLLEGRPGVTPELVEMSKEARAAYAEEKLVSVEDRVEEVQHAADLEKEIRRRTYTAYDDAEETAALEVFGAEGYRPSVSSMSAVPPRKCTHALEGVSKAGRSVTCGNYAVTGMSVCEAHGGIAATVEDMREVMRRSHVRIIGATGYAVDMLLDLLQSSPNDLVRLKAAEALLDRAGLIPGVRIEHQVTDADDSGKWSAESPTSLIKQRLNMLASNTMRSYDSGVQHETADIISGDIEEDDIPEPTRLDVETVLRHDDPLDPEPF
jgi:hypothetical protein